MSLMNLTAVEKEKKIKNKEVTVFLCTLLGFTTA